MESGKQKIIEYAKKSLLDELYATTIYSKLEYLFKDERVKEKFRKMAQMEARHAEFWLSFLKRRGINTKDIKTNKFLIMLKTFFYRIIGVALALKLMEIGEREAAKIYALMLESEELSEDEENRLRDSQRRTSPRTRIG